MLDKHIIKLHGNKPPTEGFLSSVYQRFLSHTDPNAAKPGYNLGIYTGQSVTGMHFDFRKRAKLLVKFIDRYKENAEKILGKKIELSDRGIELLRELREYVKDSSKSLPKVKTNLNSRGTIRTIMSEIQEDIYKGIIRGTSPEINPDIFKYRQALLLKKVKAMSLYRYNMTFLVNYRDYNLSNIDVNVRFGYDGDCIILYDKKLKRVVAYTRKLNDIEKLNIKRSTIQVVKENVNKLKYLIKDCLIRNLRAI